MGRFVGTMALPNARVACGMHSILNKTGRNRHLISGGPCNNAQLMSFKLLNLAIGSR